MDGIYHANFLRILKWCYLYDDSSNFKIDTNSDDRVMLYEIIGEAPHFVGFTSNETGIWYGMPSNYQRIDMRCFIWV